MPVKVSQLLPPPAKIPVGDQFMEVRGLALPELVELIANHRNDFIQMLVLLRAGTQNLVEVVQMAPQMVSDIVCYATNSKGDPDEEAAVSQLPAGVQLIAMTEIWKLTVTDQKKIQDLLLKAMAEVRRLSANVAARAASPAPTLEVSPPKSET
jgi:hypothetical protein